MRCSGCAAENAPDCRFCSECGARLVSICPSCRFDGREVLRRLRRTIDRCRRTNGDAARARKLHAEATCRENSAQPRRAGRRAQAGDGTVCRHQGFHGAYPRRRPGGCAAHPRSDHRGDDACRAPLRRHVNKVLGDGIMALFGAPIAHEDHAVRACYAALAMRNALREISEKPTSSAASWQVRRAEDYILVKHQLPRRRRL